ncbi:hypothetical protein BD560DRAFT_401427 [Blakeslea trispora]|nr:hypothetical protein BD560DRAFT_401427 [Blakeslea trispora]
MKDAFVCDSCTKSFNVAKSLYNHKTDYHNESCTIQVINEKTNEKERITFIRLNGAYNCCGNMFQTTSSFKKHYKSEHPNGIKSNHCKSHNNENTIEKHSGTEEVDEQEKVYLFPRLTSTPGLPEVSDAYVIPSLQRNYEQAVLYSCQGEDGNEREKTILLTVSESLGLTPFAVIDAEGQEENALAHKNIVSRLCDNEKQNLTFKRTDNVKRNYNGDLKRDYCCLLSSTHEINQPGLSSLLYSCPIKNILKTRKFIELTNDMCKLLNEDWELRPQMRYFCARALAGSIIVNNKDNLAVLVNTVEVYGRNKSSDAHHERYFNMSSSGLLNSTLPPVITRYKNFWVTTSIQDNSTKLLFASKTFNALVTSSYRLDGNHDAEVGPSTTHFRLDMMPLFENAVSTQIYVDKDSWSEAMELATNEDTLQVQTYNHLYQLRQVRSKFYAPTTYTMCRSSSVFVDDHTSQPLTIFTYVDLDDNRKSSSDGKIASAVFKMIAIQVIKHQNEATVSRKEVEKFKSSAKNEKKIQQILDAILGLFESDVDAISIIDNEDLDRQLKELAEILNSYLNTSNKNVAKSITQKFKFLSSA